MSNYAEKIHDILNNANSQKIMDKKKCITELLELYNSQDALKEICKNTEQKNKGVANWPYILHTVHKLLLNEVDRHATRDRNKTQAERRNTCTLILKTVQNANTDKAQLLKCMDLVPLIFQILEKRIYENYHDTYLMILVKYVLPFRTYQVDMLPEQWEELLTMCVGLYKNDSPYTSKRTILDALQMIISYGSSQSNLVLHVKKMLPFLENVFVDMKSKQELLSDSAFKLVNTVCQEIATECRIALCQFSENVLPNVIDNSSIEKYKLLLLFVQIHHPKGVSSVCDGAYASNWEKWNCILKNIYLMIVKDCKPDLLPKSLVHLSSEVFKQVLERTNLISEIKSFDDGDYLQSTKRRRISAAIRGPVDMIANNNPEEAWPMIQILIELLKKYPDCLKSEDLAPFLKILVELLTQSCKQEDITDDCYRLAAVLLIHEKQFFATDIENSNIHWNKIWDILLRSLNMNQNVVSSHKLAQLFITSKKVMSPNTLLRLYLTNVIKWSAMSLRTLILFCEHLPLPMDISIFNINIYPAVMDSNSVRLYLLKWILNIPWQTMATQILVDELCSLMIGITLKSKYEKQLKFDENGNNSTCNCLQRDEMSDNFESASFLQIERCYSLLTYSANIFVQTEKEVAEEVAETSDNMLYEQDLLTYLTDDLCGTSNEDSGNDDLCVTIIKIAVIGKIASMMKQLNMVSGDISESVLVRTMKNHLVNANTLLANIDPFRTKYNVLLNVTRTLSALYSTSYDTEIAKIIVSSSTRDMLKNVFDLMNIEDSDIIDHQMINNYYDYYDNYTIFQGRRKRAEKDAPRKRCSFCNNGVIRIQATEVLTRFCSMNVGKEKFETQTKLMAHLLAINMYDLPCPVDFKMAMIVLESLTDYGKEELWAKHEDTPLKVLMELHRQCHTDETAIQHILNVLPYFFQYAKEYKFLSMDLVNIFAQVQRFLSEKRYGFLVHVNFIDCLTRIIQTDPSFFWYASPESANETIMKYVLSFVSSPVCLVRLHAVPCIYKIYSSNDIEFKWKEAFFVQLEETVNNLFVINRHLEENEKIDERENRVASALLALTAVICTNGTLQSRALLTMLRLAVEKKITFQDIRNTLHVIEDQISYGDLIESNLNFLLSYWLNSKYSGKPFPWMLTQCETDEEFRKIYINMLVSITFRSLNCTEAASLCDSVGSRFEDVFENVFPEILSWLLYRVCETTDSSATMKATKMFYGLLSNEDQFTGVRKFSVLFEEKFEDVIIYLVRRLHDEEHFERVLEARTSLPKSDPPHFQKEEIDKCLKHVQENFFAQGKSLQYILACNCPDSLQRILLRLVDDIYKKQFLEHKLKAFHQYVYFSAMIVQELDLDYFNPLAMYLVRDIGYSLLHLIKTNDSALSELACKYFYTFVKSILPARSKEMKEILNFSVMTLIPVAQTERTPVALKTLKFLIIDQKQVLHADIAKLNSFPNIPVFQEIRNVHNSLKYKEERSYTLEKEIQHFLNAVIDENSNCSVEDISHLRLQLSSRKEELREIYKKLEKLRGFAEDCASSMLHQLIYRLVKLTASSDTKISIEAAKCLGELGPVDLTTMILYLEKSHVREASDLIEILLYKALTLMTEFLIQKDIELRKASARALYTIFSSPWGRKLLKAEYAKHLKIVLGEPQTTLRLSCIQPFVAGQVKKMGRPGLNSVNVNKIINPSNDVWTIKSDGVYSKWIVETTCDIFSCFTEFYCDSLTQVCTLSTDFCELILPRIIFLVIHIDNKLTSAVCSCINRFFDYHFATETNDVSVRATGTIATCDHSIVHSMLNVVNYIRIQITEIVPLRLNYMHIAKAAHYCSAFFTAILYAEISCENILDDRYDSTTVPKIDYMCEYEPEQGAMIQNILRDSYLKIGDPDAIYGSGSWHLQDHSSRVQHYIHTRKWDKVMLAQDVELSSGNASVIREMASGLHQSGLQYLLGHFISAVSSGGKKVDDDIQYESAWRLADWNLCEASRTLNPQNESCFKPQITEINYHLYHYQALKYFHESNEVGVRSAIENARMSIIKALKSISLESTKVVYEKLMHLQLIREIEELSSAKQDEYATVLKKWREENIKNSNEFQYIEPILTQRTIMYQIRDALKDDTNIKDALVNTYLEIAKIAGNQENLHVAARSLAVLAKQQDLPLGIQDQLSYQESLLAWLRNEVEIGRFLLRSLIHKKTLDPSLRAQVLRVYGDWMAETKSENPQAVIKKYYLESINTSTSMAERTKNDINNLQDTQVALARFADAQFEQICSYMKSPQFESLKESVTYSRRGIKIDPASKDRDVRRAAIISEKQNTNDVAELEHIEKEKNNYLTLALRYYLVTLQQSEHYNLLIFRVISLWLDNTKDDEVNQLLRVHLEKISSFKFIPLIPQLAAHMNDTVDEFSRKIYKIMERCALEHPHHTLPVLLALKNLYGDYEYNSAKKNVKVTEARVLGAKKLLAQLTRSDVGPIVREMDKLSHSLVMLANLEPAKSKPGSTLKIPRSQEIVKIRDLNNVLVPTLTIHVKPSRDYNDVIGVFKYEDTFETVGGVNAPKKVICIGTDGIHRHQLVKGKDDLRQDAVMQQVFNVMNTLLKACKETKRRKLTIRTYKVVPLTQRSGVLEWCDNTIPIVIALTGSGSASGLHQKYYPNDYTAVTCREKMAAVTKQSDEAKLKVFMECCTRMHPALHHFFTEKYPSPETWFERRLAYTRSIATTSMAGYILGLGDRHLNNILIDQMTAEVIHIDFGIAFEQGIVLPIPETVPFRLTRNIEVAMGVSGIEGTLRRCCEKTLMVLRDQRQIIVTLLQVLLYDPLFTWTITPARAHDIQTGTFSGSAEINQGSSGTNRSAERALLKIEQKLQGTEEGLASSVPGQVERLIQQARDPANLCRLYYGWQPYL